MNCFKKIIACLAAVTLAVCSYSSNVSASVNESYRKGDIDGDGDVDNIDLAYLTNFLKGFRGTENDRMTQRLDVDLSGIIDNNDKNLLSNIITNHISPIYYVYETSNSSIPEQSTLEYRKYNAQTGAKIEDNYTLYPVDVISPYSIDEPEVFEESSSDLLRLYGGTDYSNKGIVGLNYKKNNTNYTGTGFIVGPNKILTAAHCMFDTSDNTPAYNVTIDVYENTGYNPNTYSAENYHIPQEYYDANAHTAYCDYAIITVNHTFPSSYFMELGVARDRLKNNLGSSVYNNICDANGINRLCLYLTGRWLQMWTEEGYFTYVGGNIMTDDLIYYIPMGYGGQSGSPVYVETEDEIKTVIGIGSGGTASFGACKRVDTDILQFVYNNSYL